MGKIVDVFKKLAKLSPVLWCVIVIATAFFADAYGIIYSTEASIKVFMESMQSYGIDFSGNIDTLRIMTYVTTPLITFGFFELILQIIYKFFYVRKQINTNVRFFKQTARVVYSAANVLVGLFGLIYFWYPDMYLTGTLCCNFAIYTLAFTFIYSILSYSIVAPVAVGKVFKRLYVFYFIFEGALSLLGLITALRSTDVLFIDKVGYGIQLGLVAIFALVLYFVYYRKLQKREENYIEMLVVDDNGKNDDKPDPPEEIFKGFGF